MAEGHPTGSLPDAALAGATRVGLPSIIRREGGLHKRAAWPGPSAVSRGGGPGGLFLLRTACVSSVPTESSHTARAAMFGHFGFRGILLPTTESGALGVLQLCEPLPVANDYLRAGRQRLGKGCLVNGSHDFAFQFHGVEPVSSTFVQRSIFQFGKASWSFFTPSSVTCVFHILT